jgi:hypothetical protein
MALKLIVAHQHPGMRSPARPTAGLSNGGQPHLPVPVAGANLSPVVSSGNDEINAAGILDAEFCGPVADVNKRKGSYQY